MQDDGDHDDSVDVDDTVIRPGSGRHRRDPSGADLDPSASDPDPFGDTVIRPHRDAGSSSGTPDAPDTAGAQNDDPQADDPFGDTVVRERGAGVGHAPDDTPAADGGSGGRRVAPHGHLPPETAGPTSRPTSTAEPGLPADPDLPTRVPSVRVGDRVLRLDRPVIIGRRPALPRIVLGPAPELVTVPSRRSEVSSSHVRIHAEGEAVVVQDLGSTNGTVVRPAGSGPRRVPSGASIVVLTGTVVEIGDGNTIEILSPFLRVQPPHHGTDRADPRPSAPPAPSRPDPRERS